MLNRPLRIAIISAFNSQAEFSQLVGLSEPALSNVIHGRRWISPREAQVWARLLTCDEELLRPLIRDTREEE